jgi:hypothetical protein
MPLIKSSMRRSRKPMVEVVVTGPSEVSRMLTKKGIMIKHGVDSECLKGASVLQTEVQESITGRRAEPKSVDTGLLANSIMTEKLKDSVYKIYPRKRKYPNSKATTWDTAKWMEYGTTKTKQRRHFRNTVKREREFIKDRLRKAVIKVTSMPFPQVKIPK